MHKRNLSDITTTVMLQRCSECGCSCGGCSSSSLDFHHTIEALQSQLIKSNSHISNLEHELIHSKRNTECEIIKLREEIQKLRDRYDRLLESHKRIQRVSHNLEDKLLNVVNEAEAEKIKLQKEAATASSRLIAAKVLVCDLQEENEKIKKDCNLAVHLLQCKPSNFVSQKLSELPLELQERVKPLMTREQFLNCTEEPEEEETNKPLAVPIMTFPPTAMVYSMNNTNQKHNKVEEVEVEDSRGVPLDLIAHALMQVESTKKPHRTFICLKCKEDVTFFDKEVQVGGHKWDAHATRERTNSFSGLKVHKSCSSSNSLLGFESHPY